MIYTSYFKRQCKQEIEDCAYISIAVGNPRYSVPYQIVDSHILKPYGIFKVYHGEMYKVKYFERLDMYGVDRIRAEIKRLQGDHKNAVLMCHESNKLDCHRSMFSEWWEMKTGEVIEEYGERKATEIEKKEEKQKVEEPEVHQMSIYEYLAFMNA